MQVLKCTKSESRTVRSFGRGSSLDDGTATVCEMLIILC